MQDVSRSPEEYAIQLKGNELKAAASHKARYFICRVYEDVKDEQWQVVALANPMEYDWQIS